MLARGATRVGTGLLRRPSTRAGIIGSATQIRVPQGTPRISSLNLPTMPEPDQEPQGLTREQLRDMGQDIARQEQEPVQEQGISIEEQLEEIRDQLQALLNLIMNLPKKSGHVIAMFNALIPRIRENIGLGQNENIHDLLRNLETRIKQEFNQKGTDLKQDLERQIRELEVRVTGLIDQKASQQDLTDLRQEVGQKASQQDLTTLRQEVGQKASQQDLTTLRQEVGQKASQEQVDLLRQELATLTRQVSEINVGEIKRQLQTLDNYHEDFVKLQKELQDYTINNDARLGVLEQALQVQKEKSQRDKQETDENITKLQDQLSRAIRALRDYINNQLQEAQQDITELKTFRQTVEARLQRSEEYQQTSDNRFRTLAQTLHDLQEKVRILGANDLVKTLQELEKKITSQFNIRVDNLVGRQADSNRRIQTLEQIVGQIDTKIRAQTDPINTRLTQIEASQTNPDQRIIDLINPINQQLRDLVQQVGAIPAQDPNLRQEIIQLQQNFQQLTRQVQAIPPVDPNLPNIIQNIQQALGQINNKVANLERVNQNIPRQIFLLSQYLNRLNQRIINLNQQGTNAQVDITNIQRDVQALNQRINAVPATDPNLPNQFAQLRADLQALTLRINNLPAPQSTSHLEQRVATLESRMDQMLKKIQETGFDRFVDEDEALKSLVVLLATGKVQELVENRSRRHILPFI